MTVLIDALIVVAQRSTGASIDQVLIGQTCNYQNTLDVHRAGVLRTTLMHQSWLVRRSTSILSIHPYNAGSGQYSYGALKGVNMRMTLIAQRSQAAQVALQKLILAKVKLGMM